MLFGSASADLMPGARNAVETCLSIRRGERVALIADEASRPVAAAISTSASDARWAEVLTASPKFAVAFVRK